MRMPGIDGLTILKRALELRPDSRIVILTAFGTIDTAVEAMKRGAFDYLVKPVDPERLKQILGQTADANRLSRMAGLSAPSGPDTDDFIALSPAMQKMRDLIRRVAAMNTTVLIHGETGTGKELVARAIHANSPRRQKAFIAVNCANLQGNLLESELFGHEKGAFTGADSRKLGKFELASGGTLFLDEVGEIPLELQAKLLRAIQEQEIERLGGVMLVRVDVRLVSATNRDLEKSVEAGRFRQDLFYRLNVFPLTLPPLRRRRDEIGALADHFLREWSEANGLIRMTLAPDALDWLKEQPWPGNIRELRNLLERAAIIDEDGVLTRDDLLKHGLGSTDDDDTGAEGAGTPSETEPLSSRLADQERTLITTALERTRGNVVAAARDLGLPRRTFYDKLKKLGIEPARFRHP